MTTGSRDGRLAIAAAVLGAAPFLAAPFCGLYADDFSFLSALEGVSPEELWIVFLQYVPGRNLHILFYHGLIELTRGSVAGMHLAGLAFDALNAALFFLLARRLTGLRSVALAAAAAFAVAPNHGETHFWITSVPQSQIPTALILAAFLLAAGGRLLPACAVYAVALFTYDQVFFLWPLLLVVAWRRDDAPRRTVYGGAAAGLLALNVTHLALRYLSPQSGGGRPLIRWADFFDRCRDAAVAVVNGVFPWPTSSHAHWAWSLPVVALALAAAFWLVRSIRAEARDEAAPLADWTEGSGWLVAAVGGAASTVLAYGPNLFWFLSPRHNLLPSIGWSLTLAAAGARAVSRSRRAAAALPWAAGLFFATAAVSNIHEGTQWIDSHRLRSEFAAAIRHLSPPVENVFVVGAPRGLRRAPAFNLPHDVIMAAGRALDRPPLLNGDYQLSPTRRGVLFRNDLSIAPASTFRWLPAGEANVLSFDPATRSFVCVSALRVESPDGPSEDLLLRPNAGCAAVRPAPADVYLAAAAAGPTARARTTSPSAGGLALLAAAATVRGETTALELEWRVDAAPRATMAFIPRLKDASGALLLDAVFPSRGARSPYPMIWPLVDDLASGLGLKPGQTLRQTFLLRRPAASFAPGAVLELDAYEIAPGGGAVPLGSVTAPVTFKR